MDTEERHLEPAAQDYSGLHAQYVQLKAENQWLREQLGLAKKRIFGPSSERTPIGQEVLAFNEAEAITDPHAPEPEMQTVQSHTRKRPGQRELQLENLPVEEIRYELPDEERVCPECAGPLHRMGEDVRQKIDIVPAQIILVKHIRGIYACRCCQRDGIQTPILTATAPTDPFPNSLASPSAVAYVMHCKYVEGTPLYRQEQSLKHLGFELSRQTMANWMIAGAGWLEAIYSRMQSLLEQRDILHADETRVQVLREPGRDAQKQSTMWLYRTGRDGPAIVLFDYQTSREGEHPRKFLRGFHGWLHSDGYAGYDSLRNVRLAGCWAHVRRAFVEAVEVLPEPARKAGHSPAHKGLQYCNDLFAVERDLHDCTPEERLAGRLERSRPILAAMRNWLDAVASACLPHTAFGKAITYCRNQWPKLTTFLEDGRLELDNNRAERSIKGFVIGRKNWLFSNTPNGARASSVIYSIVETAKENGLSPIAYLAYLLARLPDATSGDHPDIDNLLPWSEPVHNVCRLSGRP